MSKKTQHLLLATVMGTLSYILMYFSFPVMPALPFLKVDFADIPIILVAMVQGPIGALMSAVLSRGLHYLFTGGEMGIPIGDIASLIASLAYVLPIYWILKKPLQGKAMTQNLIDHEISWGRKLLAYLSGTLSMAVIMTVLNYFIITPLYIYMMNFPIDDMRAYIIYGVLPFNLLKGVIVSILGHVVVVKVLPQLLAKFGVANWQEHRV
ncbi:ECF transporter S component [Aerococcus kribbianus]|uniref:Riboflavin transporter n=1 Tax=Aerococcus kribbianus TaxID=2999064 RepID=A0A9X3FWR9_9LACT|nr:MULTISPECIES: ECF transporter S component [unclassified Aerococcus]MCZ0717659.1 ECF transporter S component [Aerococcus sp. YH-aer221]MCZ0725947.1 ECF transporter S component [Aerococcus sp. YH-aer222]